MKKFVFTSIVLVVTVCARTFSYGAFMIPHPDKAHRGGQDAFLATEDVLAVADGVGGWAQQGINPADFARTLCTNIFGQYPRNRQLYLTTPKNLIIHSQKHNHHLGSATLVVVTLDPKLKLLHAAYVGDSGYAIFRYVNNSVQLLTKSQDQQHAFNFPFQLARPELKDGDDPEVAIQREMLVLAKDIVVVGSDGLFDNVPIEEIRQELEGAIDKSTGIIINKQELAESLAKKAIQYGQDEDYDSPFSQGARQIGYDYFGGKLDDTTVIIAQVKDDDVEKASHQTSIDDIPRIQSEIGHTFEPPQENTIEKQQQTEPANPTEPQASSFPTVGQL